MVRAFFIVTLVCLAALVNQSNCATSFLSQATAAAEDISSEALADVKLEDKFGFCPRHCAKKSRKNKSVIYSVCMNRCICSAYCDYSMSEGGLTSSNYRLCVGLCVLADPYSENPTTWDRDPSCCPKSIKYVMTKKDKEYGCIC